MVKWEGDSSPSVLAYRLQRFFARDMGGLKGRMSVSLNAYDVVPAAIITSHAEPKVQRRPLVVLLHAPPVRTVEMIPNVVRALDQP